MKEGVFLEIFNVVGEFFAKDVLLSLGVAVLIGLVFNRIVKILGLPNVTGYLVAGVLIGPSFLQIIPEAWISDLTLLVNVALGFIAFSIGGEFKISKIKNIGKSVIVITMFQAIVTTAIVDIGLLLFFDPAVAISLGAIATATAPAATLMVVRQYNAKGPVTDMLMPVVALDDAVGLMVFSVSLSVSKLLVSAERVSVAYMLFEPFKEIVLSLVTGALIGVALTFGMGFFHSRSNRLTSIICAVFLGTSLSGLFNLSSLLVCMSIGAVMANFYQESDKMLDITEHWTPAVFLLFFVISGAELDFNIIPTVGLLGVLYIILRSVGKYFGAFIGSSVVHAEPNVRKYLGVALLPQAGVAIGMSQIVVTALPDEYGTKIRAVVLCATLVYELVGPLLTKLVLTKAGEITKEHSEGAAQTDISKANPQG
jgi:Kef-type K+ transport system membrane component KefB